MNDVTKDLLERITDISKMYERFGATCVFEGQPMMHLSHLEEIAELAARAEASLFEPRPNAKPAPIEAIGRILTEVMEEAVRNGAGSRSMPDDYVAVAAWISGIGTKDTPSPTPA